MPLDAALRKATATRHARRAWGLELTVPLRMRPIVVMVTDRSRYGAAGDQALEGLIAHAARAARAGVDLIQVRERGLPDRRLLDLVGRILAAARGTAARALVNTRTDVALAAGAHGVHLRGDSPPATGVRTLGPPGFLIGRSVHTIDEALAAERGGGCDYLIFGAVFPSGSKAPGHTVAGVEALRSVCAAVRLPVLAIGGITEPRAAAVATAGAAGVAGIDFIASRRDDDEKNLKETIGRIRAAFDTGR